STVGSNLSSTLPGLPPLPSATARKPLPVRWRKRSSASATALESATSNSCRVSPVRSITIWIAIVALLVTHEGLSLPLNCGGAIAWGALRLCSQSREPAHRASVVAPHDRSVTAAARGAPPHSAAPAVKRRGAA